MKWRSWKYENESTMRSSNGMKYKEMQSIGEERRKMKKIKKGIMIPFFVNGNKKIMKLPKIEKDFFNLYKGDNKFMIKSSLFEGSK